MTTFIIIRHQIVDNPKNIFYGVSNDLPISDEGKAKARDLGRQFAIAGIRPTTIITSDLLRARQTGEEFLKGLGLKKSSVSFLRRVLRIGRSTPSIKVELDTRLTDVAYPKLEGKAVDSDGCVSLETGEKVSLDHIEPYTQEPLEEAASRFNESLRAIAQQHPGELIAIVSHGDPIGYGLESLQNGNQTQFNIQYLEEKGAYLQKGEFAVVRLTSDGILNGRILFRPEIDSIPVFLEGSYGGKEGNGGV